jgi:predicted RNA-binding protein with RPS1 domain
MEHSEQTADAADHQPPDPAPLAESAEGRPSAEPAQAAQPAADVGEAGEAAPVAADTAEAGAHVPETGAAGGADSAPEDVAAASAYVPPPEADDAPADPVAANAVSFGEPAPPEPEGSESVQVEPPAAEPVQVESGQHTEPESGESAPAPVAAEASVSAEAPAAAETPAAAEAAMAPTAQAASEPPTAAEAPAATEAPAASEAAPAAEAPAAQPKPPDERRIRAQQAWERVVNARESGETLNGTVTAAVKGGLLVDVGGIRGFLPASQTRVESGTPIEAMVKAKLPLKVIDVDTGRRRIVVSHRRALQDERRAKRNELLRSLAIGQVREGVVVRIADFGAFVDLGGVDGLIPMRELAFERIEKASDVVKIGEKLQVEVIRIEDNGKKIALSRKNALPDPWRDHAAVLKQGATVEGKVVAKDPRLQVELAPGVVGSLRENDVNPADYEIGEAIEVTVRRVDRATRRITLSPVNAMPEPQPQQQTSSGFAPLGVELGRRR